MVATYDKASSNQFSFQLFEFIENQLKPVNMWAESGNLLDPSQSCRYVKGTLKNLQPDGKIVSTKDENVTMLTGGTPRNTEDRRSHRRPGLEKLHGQKEVSSRRE